MSGNDSVSTMKLILEQNQSGGDLDNIPTVTPGDLVMDSIQPNLSAMMESEAMDWKPGLEGIIIPVISSLIVFFGCIGNIIVIIVVIRNRDHFRNTTNLFILNLSIADLLFLVFCVPFHAIIYTIPWPFGTFMCKFVHLVQYSSMVASILTLVAMAADRYLALAFSLETKHLRTPLIAFITSCVIWLVALAIALPQPIVYNVHLVDLFGPSCYDDWSMVGHRKIYFLVLFILGYVLPSLTILLLSILIIRQLWLTKQPEGPRMKESINRKRKVTRLIIVVVIVFCLSWLPNHVIWIWTNFYPDSINKTYTFFYIRLFAHALSYGNSAVNPIIYAFLSANFRRGFQRAILCRNVQPRPVQRFTFTKSSQSHQSHPNQTLQPLGNGNGHHYYNLYANISNFEEGHKSSSYSDTCV